MKKLLISMVIIGLIMLNIFSIYVVYNRYQSAKNVNTVVSREFPNSINDQAESKPVTFLGSMLAPKKTVTPTPTAQPTSPTMLMNELELLFSDNAKSDINAVKQRVLQL